MTQWTNLVEPARDATVGRTDISQPRGLATLTSKKHLASVAKPTAKKEVAAKLHPKEHGAYAILTIPILTALVVTGPTLAGVCIAVAAVTGFLAHEPLLVAWGHRGHRAQACTPGAKPRLLILGSIVIVTGSAAFLAGSPSTRWTLLACLALASTSFVVAVVGRHRTLGGQLWGVSGLSLPCVPILLAGGFTMEIAVATWAIWLIGFWATTLAVRSVIAAQKRQPRTIHISILALLTLLVVASGFLPAIQLLSSLPMIALSWYLLITPPPAKQLRRVGWTLVAGTIFTALLLVGATLVTS